MVAFLQARQLHKTYHLGRVSVPVLSGVDFTLRQGEWVAILGASGSGKSTLLHLLGGLDEPDADHDSQIRFSETDLAAMSWAERNLYRSESVGFVFQFYHLLPELNVLENTLLPGMIRWGRFGYRRRRAELGSRAAELLDSFGLGNRKTHRPAELSGGERQRVAIARALLNHPALLLADEPTGNLDARTGSQILDVIAETHRNGQTIVMVTHDDRIAQRADRVVHLVEGRIQES